MSNIGKNICKFLITVVITLLFVLLIIFITVKMICSGISPNAKDLYATTMLETGQLKFMATMFLSEEELQNIVNKNTVKTMNTEIDKNLINVENADSKDMNEIKIEEVSGQTFYGKMMIINDPSRVKLATTYPWSEYGEELENIVKKDNAIGGVNGGLYVSTGNKGGYPLGAVVCEGEIQYNNSAGYAGLHLIGFDESDILRVISLEDKSTSEIEQIIRDEKIRDAVTFQEESSDANNHFVKLIVNGEEREVDGKGSGANPRTAIGQRADGTVLILVTDGRGASGHLGATAADLIKIMSEYGAVNAANLDGGSSSCMYYNDKYEMTSVTFYYANSSWKIPTAFVIKKDGSNE